MNRAQGRYWAARFDTVRILRMVLKREPTLEEVNSYLFYIPD